MLEHEYERMFRNEDSYWWYVSRRELVVDLVRKLPLGPSPRFLDIGCGTGATAAALRQFGMVTGVDMSTTALKCCQTRSVSNVLQAKAEWLPIEDGSIDVIVATDVLEHLDDDVAAVREFRRVLKPGGHAVLTVPAYQFLWSEHDVALMHKRRYVSDMLRKAVEAGGLRVEKMTYALGFLLPLALVRLLKKKPPSDKPPEAMITPVPAWLNASLVRFQRFETALLRRMNLPWGLSVVAVVRKA